MNVNQTLFVLSILCAFGSYASSAPPEMEASVNSTELFVGESIDYQLEIRNVESPQRPDVALWKENFQIELVGDQSRDQSSTYIINGRVSQKNVLSHLYVYRLTPKTAGSFTIPSLTVTVDGKSISGNAIRVRVQEPEKQDVVLIEIVPSQSRVYPTQEFSVKLRVLVRAIDDSVRDPLKPLRRSPPSLQISWLQVPEGLASNEQSEWLQPLLARSKVGFTLNGVNTQSGSLFDGPKMALFDLETGLEEKPGLDGELAEYFVYELERTFTSVKTGVYSFGPALVKGTFITGVNEREYDGRRIVAVAKPINVEVAEVPTPRPAGFTGGIGDYSVSLTATPWKLRVGDPMTLTLQFVRGKNSGSLDLVSAPDLSMNPGIADEFEIVDKNPTGRLEKNAKLFSFALRPKRAGVTIPAMPMSTFDPISESFKTIQTEPIALEVTEAATLNAGELVGSVGASKSGAEIKTRAEGIFQNITETSQLRNEQIDFAQWMKGIAGLWIGAGLAIASLVWLRRKSSDVRGQRRSQAKRNAQSRLVSAQRTLDAGDSKRSLREVRAAILGWIADTGNQNSDGLTIVDVKAALQEAHVPTEDSNTLLALLERIESSEYGAGASTNPADCIRSAAKWIEQWSPQLKQRATR